MASLREEIADILRGRILRGLNAGSVRIGDRLPSARELREEFGRADHRIILDAYRELEREGLVELRPRGGIYVADQPWRGSVPVPSSAWLTEIFAQGLAREIPVPELGPWLTQSMGTLRLLAAAVQETADQVAGLCRELRDDYGLEATGVKAAALSRIGTAHPDLRLADLLVTTTGLEGLVRPIAEALRKPLIVVEVRPDLIGGQWRLLLRKPVHVLVHEKQFVQLLQEFFARTPGAENIRYHVVGRDPLDNIPDEETVYITRSARDALGGRQVRGRLLPAARLFSASSAREIVRFIVDANLRALAASG